MYDYLMRENQRSLLLEAAQHRLLRQSQLARAAGKNINHGEQPRNYLSYRTLAWLGRQFSAWGELLQDRYDEHHDVGQMQPHSRYYGRV